MDYIIKVDKSTCIKCGKCVKICPAAIFIQVNSGSVAEVQHPENCIKCGHCVAVCPTDSVKHSVFPPEKVHLVDRNLLPSPEQMMLLIKLRRSNRAFSSQLVPVELHDQIIEAAYRAPTASNQQELEFTLVTDPDKLHQIIQLTVDVFQEKLKNVNRPIVKTLVSRITPEVFKMANRLNALVEMVKAGKDPILRGATSALFIHSSDKHAYYGKIDANLAYQNGSLMAESLGVNQFYTGFVCRAIDEDKKGRFNELLGIEGKIHAGMGLGMPALKFTKYIDKEPMKIRKI